jgi:hypothetical protein
MPANEVARVPPPGVYVRASVPLCPYCVDDPGRIKAVKQRVHAALLEEELRRRTN